MIRTQTNYLQIEKGFRIKINLFLLIKKKSDQTALNQWKQWFLDQIHLNKQATNFS